MTSTHVPPTHSDQLIVDFPAEHVLLLTFNRPKSLNAMTPQMHRDIERVMDWFNAESGLWVAIVTGAGRLFCAGADLKAWNDDQQSGDNDEQARLLANTHGFGSLSRRHSSKPVIAAVNGGGAYGGGMEIVLNSDIVISSEEAKFALPEVKRGVVAAAGGIPRLAHIAGHQLAAEMLLTGRTVSAQEAYTRFGFVNVVVPPEDVVPTALQIANSIVENSPDAVQSTKSALLLSQKLDHENAYRAHVLESSWVYKGENIKEGLKAFAEKRAPVWKNPAKL